MGRFDLNEQDVHYARELCVLVHSGQTRRGSGEPYHTHPFEMEELMTEHGYKDPVQRIFGLLHDILEDDRDQRDPVLRGALLDHVQERFGYEISNGIFVLSRNKGKLNKNQYLSPEEYLQRMRFARRKVQRTKIYDIEYNMRDPENMSRAGIERKIQEAQAFYIPRGREICPQATQMLIRNIQEYQYQQRIPITTF